MMSKVLSFVKERMSGKRFTSHRNTLKEFLSRLKDGRLFPIIGQSAVDDNR
jgi:hypothetical protein